LGGSVTLVIIDEDVNLVIEMYQSVTEVTSVTRKSSLMITFLLVRGSGNLRTSSREWALASWRGPELYSRLAWFRTLSLHAPPLCNGHPSIWNCDPVGPGIRLGFPG
jgi:hypothetical protein